MTIVCNVTSHGTTFKSLFPNACLGCLFFTFSYCRLLLSSSSKCETAMFLVSRCSITDDGDDTGLLLYCSFQYGSQQQKLCDLPVVTLHGSVFQFLSRHFRLNSDEVFIDRRRSIKSILGWHFCGDEIIISGESTHCSALLEARKLSKKRSTNNQQQMILVSGSELTSPWEPDKLLWVWQGTWPTLKPANKEAPHQKELFSCSGYSQKPSKSKAPPPIVPKSTEKETPPVAQAHAS